MQTIPAENQKIARRSENAVRPIIRTLIHDTEIAAREGYDDAKEIGLALDKAHEEQKRQAYKARCLRSMRRERTDMF